MGEAAGFRGEWLGKARDSWEESSQTLPATGSDASSSFEAFLYPVFTSLYPLSTSSSDRFLYSAFRIWWGAFRLLRRLWLRVKGHENCWTLFSRRVRLCIWSVAAPRSAVRAARRWRRRRPPSAPATTAAAKTLATLTTLRPGHHSHSSHSRSLSLIRSACSADDDHVLIVGLLELLLVTLVLCLL